MVRSGAVGGAPRMEQIINNNKDSRAPQQQQQQQQQPPPLPTLGVGGIRSSSNHNSHDRSSSSDAIHRRGDQHHSHQQHQRQAASNHPAIYAVPTTETFGDESSSSSLSLHVRHTTAASHQTPPRHGRRLLEGTAVAQQGMIAVHNNTGTASGAAAAATPSPQPRTTAAANDRSAAITSSRQRTTIASSAATPQRSGGASSISQRPAAVRRRRRLQSATSSKGGGHRDFQHEQDLPSVSVKYVNIANRSAYELNPCPSIEAWHGAARHLALVKRSSSNNNVGSVHRRLSPSLQHLELLQTMQRQVVIRQLDFSPSCGHAADYFGGASHPDHDRYASAAEMKHGKKRTMRRDGRYRAINVRQASLASLPPVAPVLSNHKVRLPSRADVGFPRALEDEVAQKQREILHETQWEEATPRLIAIITSDFLGSAVAVDDMDHDTHNSNSGESRTRALHLQYNGGGLEGMPYCGREIIRAKEWNASQWGRRRNNSINTSSANNTTAVEPQQFHEDVLKPNPYSMLAPPLDATYSKSEHWRPRPFHDRPAGRIYALACPTAVEFAVGDLEPLVASLTLYTLPTVALPSSSSGKLRSSNTSSAVTFGKISEDFWFPVGDWKGKVDMDAARREDGSIDDGLLASWFDRKSKAIFSYDPLSLPKGAGGRESLHVVLQIYKLAHLNATDIYTKSTIDPATVRQRADRCFQQYGAKLLTPLCFGVTRLYGNSNSGEEQQQWPLGITQDIQLYAYPIVPDSVEAFVDRLSSISTGRVQASERDSSPEGEQNSETQSEVNGAYAIPSKRRMVSRLFRSPAKVAPRSRSVPPSDLTTSKAEDEMIDGHASLFVSALGVDFLESMLTTPPELEGRARNDRRSPSLPSLLVDPTGDVAVVLGASQRVESLPAGAQKRSDLVRLPVLSPSAGYIEASEFREVLNFTARRGKHYDTDTPLSYRSLVNLLYLYPRSLRLLVDSSTPYRNSLTVRIRLIHNETSIDNDSGNAVASRNIVMKSIHPCSSWVSPGLVDTVFTKIREDTRSGQSLDLTAGVPMNDEVKVQLPMIIEGSFTLQFVLFSVELTPDAGASITQIAEATIPLSSSSKQDAAAGGKVTTVIPNGNHRLRLGDFQLQIESRLISSVHIGDPSVALILREFPYVKPRQDNEKGGIKMFLGHSNSSQLIDSVFDVNESFPPLFLTAASASSVVAHFQVLLHMHLCNLVNLRDDQQNGDFGSGARFLKGNMLSLFELLRKVKSSLTYHRESGNRSLACFFKSQLDAFDEGSLSPSSNREVSSTVSGSVNDTDSVQVDPPNTTHDDAPPPEDETPGGGVMHRRSRTSFARQHEIRVSRIVSALGASGIPFSRVAYGVSKTDRMRVEAELVQFEGATLDHFFDDDETIATTSTFQVASMTAPKEQIKLYHRHESLRSNLNSLKSAISMDDTTRKSSVSMDDTTDNSILRDSTPASSMAKGHTQSSKSIGDTGAYYSL
jgi:hypothetical protein